MYRRQLIKCIGTMIGGGLSLPTILAMKQLDSLKSVSNHFEFTEQQLLLVTDIAQQIIPKTDTAGAVEAGVPAFIEMMLKDCYQLAEQQSFETGLQELQHVGYLTKSGAEKIEILKSIEQKSKDLMKAYNVQQSKIGDNEDKELMVITKRGLPFWRLMKELTLIGYFTSEIFF